MRGEAFNQRVFFRLFSSILCEYSMNDGASALALESDEKNHELSEGIDVEEGLVKAAVGVSTRPPVRLTAHSTLSFRTSTTAK
jgi:hypothetical protein